MVNKQMSNFFKYMGFGFVILCVKAVIYFPKPLDVIHYVFFTFWECFTISIWIGLAYMATIDIYLFLKKKVKNILTLKT